MKEAIPYGHCHCGCGEKTSLSKWTDKRIGTVKGQPYRYINGHSGRVPVAERFWTNVDKSGECWEWTATRHRQEYGIIGIGNKTYKTHRVSWEMAYGEIPKGISVLHKCDNPSCVRPDHLFLGTQDDNMKDCKRKGRIKNVPQYGEENPVSILKEEDVLEMRRLRAEKGMSYKKIASQYGVSTMTAFRATTGQSWKHLTEGVCR